MSTSGRRTTDPLARHDVVGQVGVDRGADLVRAGLDLGDEPQQRPPVVGLGETLALHQAAALELRVRVEEPVGGDQLDPGGARPAGQQLPQDPGGGGLADRHRPGHADDERGALGLLAAGSRW